MKIIKDNVAYVQKSDINGLNYTNLAIPESILNKLFDSGIIIIDNSNRYEFVKFDAPEEIEFFKKIDWIIDYNEIMKLSEEEINALGQSIVDEKNSIAQKYNSMTPEEQEKNMNIVLQWELLDFKMYSLRDALWIKQGRIEIEMPKEVDYPVGYEQEKNIRKLIKTIFDKKKK